MKIAQNRSFMSHRQIRKDFLLSQRQNNKTNILATEHSDGKDRNIKAHVQHSRAQSQYSKTQQTRDTKSPSTSSQ